MALPANGVARQALSHLQTSIMSLSRCLKVHGAACEQA